MNLVTSTHLNVIRQISSKSKWSILEKYPRFCKYLFFTPTGARTKSEVIYIFGLWLLVYEQHGSQSGVSTSGNILLLKSNLCLWVLQNCTNIWVILRMKNCLSGCFEKKYNFIGKVHSWFCRESSKVNFIGKVHPN